MAEHTMYCASCGTDMLFEAPPCLDGHDDCAEMLCTGCGMAIFLAPVVVWSYPHSQDAKIAPQPRRAA